MRRIFVLANVLGVLFLVALGRLCFVMLMPSTPRLKSTLPAWAEPLSMRSELEHFHVTRVDTNRGRILYRSGIVWPATVLMKDTVTQQSRPANSANAGHPGLTPHTTENTQPDPVVGTIGLPDKWPSSDRSVAEQGRTGLEYTFDRVLTAGQPDLTAELHDVRGGPVTSVFHLQGSSGCDVRTTVEYAWQKAVQKALVQSHVSKGAAVVLDVKSGDILALASQDRTHPSVNHAIKAAVPGSVFKLVVATAALESYTVRLTDTFVCNGQVNLPGVHMRCWKTHGTESFQEAFANSCDVVFAETGVRVGRPAIAAMASRLGIGDTGLQSWERASVLPGTEAGHVFRRHGADNGLLANTSIGQEDVRMSPLQAANLAAAIARGGLYRSARLILDLERDHHILRSFPPMPSERVMTRATAFKLTRAMEQAVTSPTGTAHSILTQYQRHSHSHSANSNLDHSGNALPSLAVKTGTAELPDRNVNAWMVGFLPAIHPEIAFAVLVADEHSATAHNQVQQVVQHLRQGYMQFQAPVVIK